MLLDSPDALSTFVDPEFTGLSYITYLSNLRNALWFLRLASFNLGISSDRNNPPLQTYLFRGASSCLTILVIEEPCDNFARLGVRARSTNTMSSFYDKVGTDFRHVS